jgi:hypothetical protein
MTSNDFYESSVQDFFLSSMMNFTLLASFQVSFIFLKLMILVFSVFLQSMCLIWTSIFKNYFQWTSLGPSSSIDVCAFWALYQVLFDVFNATIMCLKILLWFFFFLECNSWGMFMMKLLEGNLDCERSSLVWDDKSSFGEFYFQLNGRYCYLFH